MEQAAEQVLEANVARIDGERVARHGQPHFVVDELKAGLTDPDELPEPPAEPYVKPGDLCRLGDHRHQNGQP